MIERFSVCFLYSLFSQPPINNTNTWKKIKLKLPFQLFDTREYVFKVLSTKNVTRIPPRKIIMAKKNFIYPYLHETSKVISRKHVGKDVIVIVQM